MTTHPITAIVIAKNEAKMITHCLECLKWCQEIIVVNNGSTDRTAEISEQAGAKVFDIKSDSFAHLRTDVIKRTSHPWVFYVDADERVTPALAQEIIDTIQHNDDITALTIHRENFFYGYFLKNGGWEKDYVTRVFLKSKLKSWFGNIHESPEYTGEQFILQNSLLHLSHRNTKENLLKSSEWTILEAELINKALTKKITFGIICRKFLMEFIRRAIFKKGYRDGQAGLIESLVQAINRALVYIQVWELQQNPSISKKYLTEDQKVLKAWSIYQFKQ